MNELIQYLKGYQAWRRGQDERTMSDAGINPVELGQRIDEAIELIEQLGNRNRSLTDKVVELKKTMTSTEQERDQLKELALQLCDAVENNDDLPPIKYALKCGYLVNQLRQKAQEINNAKS